MTHMRGLAAAAFLAGAAVLVPSCGKDGKDGAPGAAGTGGSGGGEGDFSTWTEIHGAVIAGSASSRIHDVQVDNLGNVCFYENITGSIYFMSKNGTQIMKKLALNSVPNFVHGMDMSALSGKYCAFINTTDTQGEIFKDGAAFSTIPLSFTTDWDSPEFIAVGISPDGKYIALVGIAFSGGLRLEIHEGS